MSSQNANPVTLEGTMSSAPSEEQHPSHSAETGEVIGERSLDAIKEEILLHKGQTEQSFIEMGKLLTEAKGRVKHGQWLHWLRDNIDISHITACRLMKIATEYSNMSPVTHLGFTKVSILVTLEVNERNKIIAKQHKVKGVLKSVQEMSKSELQTVVDAHKKALRKPPDDNPEAEIEMKPSLKESQIDPLTAFRNNLDNLQDHVDSIISRQADDPHTYEEAVSALRTFYETILHRIPMEE